MDTAKLCYEIWIRDSEGKARRVTGDHTHDSYDQAQYEIERRDLPANAEYFIKEVRFSVTPKLRLNQGSPWLGNKRRDPGSPTET
jgi:hypothetical protein